MFKTIAFLIACFSCMLPVNLFSQETSRVSLNQETQVLRKGAKSIFRCEIFYDQEKDVIITHYYYPTEFIKMSNRLGELKIYFPKENAVSIQQDPTFSSTNETVYYFVNNKMMDLGLSKEGFRLLKTTHEEDLIVTTWQAPPSLKGIKEIKIVYREAVPIYAEYISTSGAVIKKLYYSQYQDFSSFRLPLRITEISFSSPSDSTISRSVYSNIRTSGFPASNYFDFKIPANAKIKKN